MASIMPSPLPIGAPLPTGPEFEAPASGGGGGGAWAMIEKHVEITKINIANVLFILV